MKPEKTFQDYVTATYARKSVLHVKSCAEKFCSHISDKGNNLQRNREV